LSDLHVSLANQFHIATLVNEVKKKHVSSRTGRDGKGLLQTRYLYSPLTSISTGLVQSNLFEADAEQSTIREEMMVQPQNKSGNSESLAGIWTQKNVKRRCTSSLPLPSFLWE